MEAESVCLRENAFQKSLLLLGGITFFPMVAWQFLQHGIVSLGQTAHIVRGVIQTLIGCVLILLSVSSVRGLFCTKLVLDSAGITYETSGVFSRWYRRFVPWSEIRTVVTSETRRGAVPQFVVLDDGISWRRFDTFSSLHLAMPIIRRNVPEENIQDVKQWQAQKSS